MFLIKLPYPWYVVHTLTTSYEKTSSNFGDYVTRWGVDNSSRIFSILTTFVMQFWQHLSCNFDNICHVILKKKLFLLVIVWVNRSSKDICVSEPPYRKLYLSVYRIWKHILTFSNTFHQILLWIQGFGFLGFHLLY